MRESIGGGWLFGVVIVFIFLFSGFLAYSISYTRAFNVKNEVINYIEHNEGFSTYKGGNIENDTYDNRQKTVQGKIYNLINNVGYDFEGNSSIRCKDKGTNYYGVCISKVCSTKNDPVSNVYYKVTAYINFNLPFINAGITIPISGETRQIYTDGGSAPCSLPE